MARGSHISIDGKSSVDQGDGYPHQSLGSKVVRCDLDQAFNWWRIREMHPDPCPRDLNGVPHRWCSNGHYSPIAAYNKDKSRADGYDPYCRQCRREMVEQSKRTSKETTNT